MTNEDEHTRLRLLDGFLDDGEPDLDDWHAEVHAAELKVKKAHLHKIRALLDRETGSSVIPIDRARLRVQLQKAMASGGATPLTLAARGTHPEDIEVLIGDLAELERMDPDKPK